MFQETRKRLALWYTTVTAVLLLVFATVVYAYVRHTLVDRIDDTLKHVVEVIDRSLIIQSVPRSQGEYRVNLEASFRSNAVAVEDDHIDLEWFNPEGKLLWSTLSSPLNIPLQSHFSGKTVHLDNSHEVRQITAKIERNFYLLGYLRVSHPWFEVTKPIQQFLFDLSIGITLMIAGVAGLGWFLSGIAMQPIQQSYHSLKQFTADASHELRNPIAMIQMNVQMALKYQYFHEQTYKNQLQVIERLSQRLGNLVNDLLFLARSDSGIIQQEKQPIFLDALLLEVIEEQRLTAESKGIMLEFNLMSHETLEENNLFTIEGDWNQMARVFTNLISNAIDYHSCPKDRSPVVKINLQFNKNKGIVIEIEDNGQGIPETALPHIFDRFYRVDPTRRPPSSHSTSTGTGLGLAIVKAIVENHQGQIMVNSLLDRGTTFTILFN